nr:MAG TPA: hypothetical protein [Caudoviricetes sp.]
MGMTPHLHRECAFADANGFSDLPVMVSVLMENASQGKIRNIAVAPNRRLPSSSNTLVHSFFASFTVRAATASSTSYSPMQLMWLYVLSCASAPSFQTFRLAYLPGFSPAFRYASPRLSASTSKLPQTSRTASIVYFAILSTSSDITAHLMVCKPVALPPEQIEPVRELLPCAVILAVVSFQIAVVAEPVCSSLFVHPVQFIGQPNQIQMAIIITADDAHIGSRAVVVAPNLPLNSCGQILHVGLLFGRGGNILLHEHQKRIRIPQLLIIGNVEHGLFLLSVNLAPLHFLNILVDFLQRSPCGLAVLREARPQAPHCLCLALDVSGPEASITPVASSKEVSAI